MILKWTTYQVTISPWNWRDCVKTTSLSGGGGGGCYLHVVPLATYFRRLNTPSTCLPWVASRIGGRRDPGGWGRRSLRTLYSQHTTLALISLRRVVWWARPDQLASLVDLVSIFVYYHLISLAIIQDKVKGSANPIFIYTIVDTRWRWLMG